MAAPDRSRAMDTSWWCCSRTVPGQYAGAAVRPGGRQGLRRGHRQEPVESHPCVAEHGADRKVAPYTVATDMDSPNPDSGEEYQHTNTQLTTS